MTRLCPKQVAGILGGFLLLLGGEVGAIDIHASRFATPNGLSDNTVRAIHQDSKGYIWFGTFDGLSRYDGYDIARISPPEEQATETDTQIRRLVEDSAGYLWAMGGHGIVSCYDLNREAFVEFAPEGEDNPKFLYIEEMPDGSIWLWGEYDILRVEHTAQGLSSRRILEPTAGANPVIRIGTEAGGRTLISTARGLWAWEKGAAKLLDASRTYQWIMPTPTASLLVATNGEIVRIGPDDAVEVLGKIDGITRREELTGAFESRGKWYLTTTKGGVSIDTATHRIAPIRPDLDIPSAIVLTDRLGDIWLYNNTGYLYFFDKRADKLVPLRLFPEKMLKLIDMERYSVVRDRQGRAWIATGGNGLFVFDPADASLEHFTAKGGNYQILPSDRLLSAALDHQGNVWVGGERSGAAMLKFDTAGVESLPLPSGVRSMYRSAEGEIYIACLDGNLYRYSPDLKDRKVLPRGAVIYDMAADARGNRWEATRGQGLLLNGRQPDASLPELTAKDVFCVFVDRRNRLWVGTFGSGLDIVVPSADGTTFAKRNVLNRTYGQKRVRDILEDREGAVWVATNEGAYRFDPEKLLAGEDAGTLYNRENGTLRANEAHCLLEDADGRIWIGMANHGISILDFSAGTGVPEITHLGTENGLSHNNVQAFVEESPDYIWATTLYGVSRIHTKRLEIESFAFMPTPGGNVHNSNSALLLADGRLLLGTNQGAYTVDLADLSRNSSAWPITVTSFRVNGDHLPFTAGKAGIAETGEGVYSVTLPYNRNSLDFAFSTFDFEWPKQTKFRYRLEPVDADWSEVSAENALSFKNLAPGRYRLCVEASEGSGAWDKRFVCDIRIRTPWWSSWWAKIVYALLLLTGGWLVVGVIQHIRDLHGKVKIEEQLTDYKLEFFTNISHEFRTPLTLIQVSLEKLHEKLLTLKSEHPGLPMSGLRFPLATLDKNARRMSRLIDELLTFRKVEKGKLGLCPEPTEVIGFLRAIYDNFKDEAVSKRLACDFRSDREAFPMNVDRNALEKIANNLLSNAIKYTREGGRVLFEVAVAEEQRQLRLRVVDNGVGIAPEKREQLFSRFMQSAMSRNSIGVGLHLTFGLVELHRGTIAHADNEGGGSIFTVTLPTDLPASEHQHEEGIGRPSFEAIFKNDGPFEPFGLVEAAPSEEHRRRMLIIDDDADIRNFLSAEFSRYYTILLASDGQSGLEAARSHDVHIIICDVMMPDMSGFEVTRLLKEDFATSHIPIIQLTALSNDDWQVEGISSGADAYVTKPFNLRYLMTRAAKLIEQRENLFAKFSATPTLARPQLPMGDQDRAFADKLAELVERELANESFSADDFAAEMMLGRTIFFRKVKGVTGYSPKEYLRVMRMKRAAELLLTTDMTITEIAYRVGISNPAYFNKCFKAQFGKAPSVYQRENTRQPDEPAIGGTESE